MSAATSNDGNTAATANDEKHACEVEVTFATNLQAEQAVQVMQVDQEPSDRVTKRYELIQKQDGTAAMKVRFESKELKMLRVSVSSFYDYLSVVIKTFQEFDETTVGQK